jgi:hypothetical protein
MSYAVHHASLFSNCAPQDTENKVVKTPAGEGCSLKGDLVVAKVGGNFHIATGTLGMNRSPLIMLTGGLFGMLGSAGAFSGANLSHTIHHLSFGDNFPGLANPLHEVTNIVPIDVGQYQFHIKVRYDSCVQRMISSLAIFLKLRVRACLRCCFTYLSCTLFAGYPDGLPTIAKGSDLFKPVLFKRTIPSS